MVISWDCIILRCTIQLAHTRARLKTSNHGESDRKEIVGDIEQIDFDDSCPLVAGVGRDIDDNHRRFCG